MARAEQKREIVDSVSAKADSGATNEIVSHTMGHMRENVVREKGNEAHSPRAGVPDMLEQRSWISFLALPLPVI